MRSRETSIIFGIFLLFAYVTSSKLNVPRVLLPVFRDVSVNFTLQVIGTGCFKWTTTRPDLVEIIPMTEGSGLNRCSLKARLSVLSRSLARGIAVVLAEDVSNPQVFRTDIILDVISSLNVVTKTRELFLDDSPELFEVRAYNSLGDEFSTLEGVEFEWSIINGPRENYPVLKFISFRESSYETPHSMYRFDQEGRKGHMVLLEGMKTGSGQVEVHLPYVEYKNVKRTIVPITVVENLILSPAEAYVACGDTIKYSLTQIRQGRVIAVDLAAKRFSLESEDHKIASVQNELIMAKSHGKVKISLKDTTLPVDLETSKFPKAILIVVEPFYLTLSMVPYNNWIILSGQTATIHVELFDRDNHKLQIGQNLRVNTVVSSESFSITESTPNMTFIRGVGAQPQVGQVKSALITTNRGSCPSLTIIPSASELLNVVPALKLDPPFVFVPWSERISKFHLNYLVSGGDGSLTWRSTNEAVASVGQSGQLNVFSIGESTIEVCLQWDTECYGKATSSVVVLRPARLEILDHTYEAEVGQPIFLNVVLYRHVSVRPGSKLEKVRITQCQFLEFHVTTEDGFYYNSSLERTPVGEACGVVAIVPTQAGLSKVSVSYGSGKDELTGYTVVSAYKPLQPLHPAPTKAYVVLAVGSSIQIAFADGPFPGIRKLTSEVSADKNLIRYETLASKQPIYAFKVSCLTIGETDFTLSVKSDPLVQRCCGIEATAVITVVCASPAYLSVKTEKDPLCPAKSEESTLTSVSSHLNLIVTVKDSAGREFDNATSLSFDWIFDPRDGAFTDLRDSVLLKETEHSSGLMIPSGHFKPVTVKNKTGNLMITGKVVGYRRSILNSLRISTPASPQQTSALENFVLVTVVKQTTAEPTSVSVVNHPDNRVTVRVTNGSGYYDFKLSPPDLAQFEFAQPNLVISPKNEGKGVLFIRDLCAATDPVRVDLLVLKVASIKVEIPDKILLGSSFFAIVKLFDSDDHPLAFPRITKDELDLKLTFGHPSIVQLDRGGSPISFSEKSKGVVQVPLKAATLGETIIMFKCMDVASEVINVQVFEPIKIMPRTLTLTLGAEVQVSVRGGPLPDPGIQFIVGDTYSISVSLNGIVKGVHLGRSSLNAMAVGLNGQVHCRDSIEVQVVALEGVRIASPISRIGVGNTIPLWASGVPPSITPFILGSVTPSLKFKWASSSTSVAQLRNPLQDAGIEVKDEDKLSMRLKGLKPGLVQITLSVTGRNQDRSTFVHNSSLELEIFELHQWEIPKLQSATLLVAPGSEFRIKTSKEDEEIEYSVIDIDSSLDGAAGADKSLVKVDSSGTLSVRSYGTGFSDVIARSYYNPPQILTLGIQVKDVQYMMTNVLSELEMPEVSDAGLQSFPQGIQLKLQTTYHDQFGSVFYSAPSNIKMKANIFDKVHFSQSSPETSFVNLERPGSTSLKIYNTAGSQLEDFLKIPVENHISPRRTHLSEGEIICLSLVSCGMSGTWKSENRNVVAVDKTGVARALRTGSSVVTFTANEPNIRVMSSTTIEVYPALSLHFGSPTRSIITNSSPGSKFSVPVHFLNEKHRKESPNSINFPAMKCHPTVAEYQASFPFTCEIRYESQVYALPVENVFSVRPSFDLDIGAFTCEITVLNGPNYNLSVIASNITLTAKHQRLPTESTRLRFVPSVYVPTPKLYYHPERNGSPLTIIGVDEVLDQLIVESDATNIVSVKTPSRRPQMAMYLVELDGRFWMQTNKRGGDHYVTVRSPLTSQTIQIPIFIDEQREIFYDQDGDKKSYNNPFVASILQGFFSYPNWILGIIIPLVLLVYAYLNVPPSDTLDYEQMQYNAVYNHGRGPELDNLIDEARGHPRPSRCRSL